MQSAFAPEPPYRHGQRARSAVIYCNLGTPASPTAPDVRRYLAEFLGDPRVVEIPRLLWWPILHGIILRTRPGKSAAKYRQIWTDAGSPLEVWTARQAASLERTAQDRYPGLIVRHAMRYGTPSIASVLDQLKSASVSRVLVLQAYPQYSGTTTASVIDSIGAWSRRQRHIPEFRFVNRYHDDPAYIAALAARVRRHWTVAGRSSHLLMSFHGVPQRTLELGDPYHCECLKTARLLALALGLDAAHWSVSFQSRFGRAKWVEPSTEGTLARLATSGVRSVDVVCPGFMCDCLETLEEIAIEGRELFLAHGGQGYTYIECLNDGPEAQAFLLDLADRHLVGWATDRTSEATDSAQRERALAAGAAD